MPSHDQRIAGQLLRYELVLTLRRTGRTMTLTELAAAVTAAGHPLVGRPSKAVSDALRWEVRRGRVVQRGRGRYGAGVMPDSTERWMRHRLALVGPVPG